VTPSKCVRRSEDAGHPLGVVLEPDIHLMRQELLVGHGQHTLPLICPQSVDAVMDMYIARGEEPACYTTKQDIEVPSPVAFTAARYQSSLHVTTRCVSYL
jgi:hypothetical protein